jgi:hypothetical protein
VGNYLRLTWVVTWQGVEGTRLTVSYWGREHRRWLRVKSAPRKKTKESGYRAAAVFVCNCELAGSSRGIAAISLWVYSCCGFEKIRSVSPHSTISPW